MLMKGQKINDRYQIIRSIGEGGMANVYLAHDTILDRNVAVKILRGDLAQDEKFVKKFQREANAAATIIHPNVVEMYDVGKDDDNYFIVMEYIDGQTLKNLIKKRGALTLPEVIDIMLQLTSAIECAHDKYIIHRDIKPQNILMLDDGTIKVTDFGIATAINAQELTQTNSVMGSVHYLPPEMANGSGSTIRSDIYSMGILMFELLTGKVPFKGDNAVEVAIKQLKEPIPSVTKINPEIPQSVENIILACCAKNPKNRYKNVTEMRNDLLECMKEENRNVRRLVYSYPEHEDIEETKNLEDVKEFIREERKEEGENKVVKQKKKKGLDLAVWISGAIFLFLVAASLVFVIFFSTGKTKEEIEVPNVAGLTILEAENKLKEKGFIVADEYEEKYSNDVAEGSVISTSPVAGAKRVKDTKITLIISKGSNAIKIENYLGKEYDEVKKMLEEKGLYVFPEKMEVNKSDSKYKKNQIIKQSIEPGKLLEEGDSITLTIPDIVVTYPDFNLEGYSRASIESFCSDNDINCSFTEVETDEYAPGVIISQSRPEGSVVTAKASLVIKIAVAKGE